MKEKISNWIEVSLITLIFIGLSRFLQDPLSLNSAFPWIWFAPVLIALNYGFFHAQFSFILLITCYFFTHQGSIYEIHLQLFILGGFILTLLCAGWQNSWAKKVAQSQGISEYLQKRIQIIADAYKLTTLAYKRLENSYTANPVTIRSSMMELREMLGHVETCPLEKTLERLLNILATNCALDKAAFYPVHHRKVIPKAITSIGNVKAPATDNSFVIDCLENKKMTYVTADEILQGHLSDYFVGAPLLDQRNHIYALLLVEEIPFLSLNEENLSTLNLLLQYFIEGNAVTNADRIVEKYPDCPVIFANEFQRLFNLYHSARKDSAIEVFTFLEKKHENDYAFRLRQEARGLDSYWETTHNGTKYLFVLMPFTNREAAETYKLRINTLLSAEYGFTLNQSQIRFNSYQLSTTSSPVELIEEIFNRKW